MENGMTNRRLSVTEFGDLLIRTQDLDPAYVGLVGAGLGRDQLCRWLLAYWCFYHVGAACWLSEFKGKEYWELMLEAAENTKGPNLRKMPGERWPRAAERRHFRGQKCVDAVLWFWAGHAKDPEHYVLQFIAPNDNGSERQWTEKVIMSRVQEWPMFGPWIAFKAADMLERCAGVPVKFDANLGLMYEEPRAALNLLAQKNMTETHQEITQSSTQGNSSFSTSVDRKMTAEEWYNLLSMYFRAQLAPPALDRVCGPQELETVLCKWKSYMGGHYHVGKDIHDHRGALAGWGSTATSMLAKMPREVEQ